MSRWVRAAAWAALAVTAGTHIWESSQDWRFYGFTLDDRMSVFGWVCALVFIVLPPVTWFGPPLGVWLLAKARLVGGGRWGWRWGCGALLTSGFVGFGHDAYRTLVTPDLSADHSHWRPLVGFTLAVVCIGPVWVLSNSRPRYVGREKTASLIKQV